MLEEGGQPRGCEPARRKQTRPCGGGRRGRGCELARLKQTCLRSAGSGAAAGCGTCIVSPPVRRCPVDAPCDCTALGGGLAAGPARVGTASCAGMSRRVARDASDGSRKRGGGGAGCLAASRVRACASHFALGEARAMASWLACQRSATSARAGTAQAVRLGVVCALQGKTAGAGAGAGVGLWADNTGRRLCAHCGSGLVALSATGAEAAALGSLSMVTLTSARSGSARGRRTRGCELVRRMQTRLRFGLPTPWAAFGAEWLPLESACRAIASSVVCSDVAWAAPPAPEGGITMPPGGKRLDVEASLGGLVPVVVGMAPAPLSPSARDVRSVSTVAKKAFRGSLLSTILAVAIEGSRVLHAVVGSQILA